MSGTTLVCIVALVLDAVSIGVTITDTVRNRRRRTRPRPPGVVFAAGAWVRYQGQLARVSWPLFAQTAAVINNVYAVEWYDAEYGHRETFLMGDELSPAVPTEEELTTWTIATLSA